MTHGQRMQERIFGQRLPARGADTLLEIDAWILGETGRQSRKPLLAFRQHVTDREAHDEQQIEAKHPLLQ